MTINTDHLVYLSALENLRDRVEGRFTPVFEASTHPRNFIVLLRDKETGRFSVIHYFLQNPNTKWDHAFDTQDKSYIDALASLEQAIEYACKYLRKDKERYQ